MNLSKSQKAIIILSLIWTIISLFIAAGGFSITTFLMIFFISASPVWLYWAGVWIWGFGYIYKTARKCVPKRKVDSSAIANKPKSAFTIISIIKKIVAVIIALFVAGIIVTIMRSLGDTMVMSLSGSDEVKRNLEAVGNIFILILMIVVPTKVYKAIVKDKNS